VSKVKKIPIEIRDCRSRESIEQALRDGACVRMGRLAALIGPYWSLGFYCDWEGDGEVAPNDQFVLEAELVLKTVEYRSELTEEKREHYYSVAREALWRWRTIDRVHGGESIPDPASILTEPKAGGSPMKRDTGSVVTSLLADMRKMANLTKAYARASATYSSAPAEVVKHAVFEEAVWMQSPPGWRLAPDTLWPLTDDRMVHDVVFALSDNRAVVVSARVLRDAKRVLGRRPGLRSTVDDEGLHLRWGEFGGLDLRNQEPGVRLDAGSVVVPLANPTYKAA
jgi:hypothetical protein